MAAKKKAAKKKTAAEKKAAPSKKVEIAKRSLWVVDDQPQVARHVSELAIELGFEARGINSAEEAISELEAGKHADAIILDRNLGKGRMDGVAAIPEIHRVRPGIPIIMLTGEASYRLAVEAIQAGAVDFVEKNDELDVQLELALARLLPVWGLVAENAALKEENSRLKQATEYFREELFRKYQMVGASFAIKDLARQIEEVAPIPRPVLIRGERGSGKELVAAAIHKASSRSGGPFVVINCAAFTEGLLECEMFGQEEGGYTDAQFRKGRFELAHKGTLFLDEIGNMPIPFQQKMLRVLEYQEFSRVGGSETIRVDVRVVAATNADLEAQMEEGSFRRDLYDRLAFEVLSLPPLRHRKEDLAPLALHFLSLLALEAPGSIPTSVSPEALEALSAYDWPGNVREFKNYIERVAYRSPGETIEKNNLLPFLRTSSWGETEPGATLKDKLRSFEEGLLRKSLAASGGTHAEVARLLGLGADELQQLLTKYDLG